MSVITLKAHFDGKQVCLDEPADFAPNTPMLVTVAQPDAADESFEEERAAWFAFSKQGLARAYGDDEPDYSNVAILERPSA
jgi:hypothetical protein